ncbi:hypothetical protein EYZ11_006268 [Aspergillus tanneri]|uniref:Uncharacterized protein n=1 Tax=Aspergillus tanneri TaxID=1220188 RepID=A0A4S3JFX2_9EURO|nr:hypothetical protein EYZ11_006268 [Aspergillus tanneri]
MAGPPQRPDFFTRFDIVQELCLPAHATANGGEEIMV